MSMRQVHHILQAFQTILKFRTLACIFFLLYFTPFVLKDLFQSNSGTNVNHLSRFPNAELSEFCLGDRRLGRLVYHVCALKFKIIKYFNIRLFCFIFCLL